MAIIASFSDKNDDNLLVGVQPLVFPWLTKSCFLMVAMALSWDFVLGQLVAMAPNWGHFKATETASH